MIARAFGELPISTGSSVLDHVDDWKGRILEALARSGPRAVNELPRRWPMTRQLNHILVSVLVADGLVEHVQDVETGRRLVRLSAAGLASVTAKAGPYMRDALAA